MIFTFLLTPFIFPLYYIMIKKVIFHNYRGNIKFNRSRSTKKIKFFKYKFSLFTLFKLENLLKQASPAAQIIAVSPSPVPKEGIERWNRLFHLHSICSASFFFLQWHPLHPLLSPLLPLVSRAESSIIFSANFTVIQQSDRVVNGWMNHESCRSWWWWCCCVLPLTIRKLCFLCCRAIPLFPSGFSFSSLFLLQNRGLSLSLSRKSLFPKNLTPKLFATFSSQIQSVALMEIIP